MSNKTPFMSNPDIHQIQHMFSLYPSDRDKTKVSYKTWRMRSTHLWGIEKENLEEDYNVLYVYSYTTLVFKVNYLKNREVAVVQLSEYWNKDVFNQSKSTSRQKSWFYNIINKVCFNVITTEGYQAGYDTAPYDPTKNGPYMGE